MTLTETAPTTDDLELARRAHARATARFLAGLAVSIAGIVFMLAVFFFYATFGSNPTGNQGLGALLLVVPAFLLSAWGTDVRTAAHRNRVGIRKTIALLREARDRG